MEKQRILIIKPEVQKTIDEGFPIRIHSRKSGHSGMIEFDTSSKPEDYDKLQRQGFRIFECSVCHKEFCDGHLPETPVEEPEFSADHLLDKLSEAELYDLDRDLDDELNETQEKIAEEFNPATLTLKDLRRLYPDIKATSRARFLEKLKEQQENGKEE